MDRSPDSSRHHSVSLPGIRTLFPDHLLSTTGGRNYQPQSTPTRPFPEQSVRSSPASDHPGPASLARPRLTVPPPPDGYRPIVPPPLGYPASTPDSINTPGSPRSAHQPNRPSISSFQPPRETARLHPVGSAPLLPRPESPSSTISENESPGSDASSQGDLSPDESLPPITADKQSDSGRRHACPHCAKRFNRPSSLAIHVNTHTGDKPFRCPFQNCGREFNVNSNMRRHYRKHLTSAAPQAPRQGSSFYSSQGSPGLDIQIIRYHDHQPDAQPPDVGSVPPTDSPDARGPRASSTRWRAL